MTKKASNKTKKPQKMSVSQFKMWIQGLSEFQDDDWVPNVNQWNLIRERIDLLDEEQHTVVHHQGPQYTPSLVQHVTLPATGVTTVPTVIAPSAPVQRFPAQPPQRPIIGAANGSERDEYGHAIVEPGTPSAFI
jgi:hypothetical protein